MSDEFAPSQEFASPDATRKVVDVVRGAQRTVNAQNTPEPTTLSPEPQPHGPAINGTVGPVADVKPGIVTNAAGWLGFAGMAPMGLMVIPAINGIPSVAGKIGQWTGAKTGWKGLETFGANRVAAAEKRSGAFERWSERQVKDIKAFGNIENSTVLNKIGGSMEGMAGGLNRLTGIGARRSKRLDKVIEGRTTQWGAAADAFETQLTHAAQHLDVTDARRKLGTLQGYMNAGGSIEAINDARLDLAKSLDALHSTAHGKELMFKDAQAESLPTAGMMKRMSRWAGFNKPAAEAAKDGKAAATNLIKEFGFLNHHAHEATTLKGKQSFWKNFSEGKFGKLGARVGEMSTSHVVMNAGVGLANLAMNINSLHSFRAQLHQFEAIYEGITGKECGFWTAMMGDVPPVLKQAQKQLLYGGMREAGINGLITGVDGALFFMKHGYAPMTVVQFAGASFRDGMACEVPLVQVEQAMADAQKKGMKLEPAHYAQLLKLAAPDTIGHVKTTNSMLVKLCNKLAAEQWTGLKVLQAVNDKTMDRMAADIQKELAEKGRQPGEEIKPEALAPAPVVAAPVTAAPVKAAAVPTIPMTKIQSMNAVHTPPASRTAAIV